MPADPDVGLMTLDEALKSVMMVEAERLLPPIDAKQLMFFVMAACHPAKPSKEEIAVATEWAFQARAQARILEYILTKKMTIFPQKDGTVKFGGRLMKVDEHAEAVKRIEEAKAKGIILLAPAPEETPK